MVNGLADIALESEATTILMMRLAGAFDRAADPGEAHFKRIGVAIAKFWTTKRAIAVVAEALECHGGNGYVEESILPRLYREAPLNSIWEGSGNVNALDVLRAMQREPESVAAYLPERERARGMDSRLDRAIDDLGKAISSSGGIEAGAPRVGPHTSAPPPCSLNARLRERARRLAVGRRRRGGGTGHMRRPP